LDDQSLNDDIDQVLAEGSSKQPLIWKNLKANMMRDSAKLNPKRSVPKGTPANEENIVLETECAIHYPSMKPDLKPSGLLRDLATNLFASVFRQKSPPKAQP